MSEAELMEVCFWQLLGPDGLRVVRDNSEAGLSEQEAAGPLETLLRTRGGCEIRVELTPYGTDWRGAAARVVIVRDISERKRDHEGDLEGFPIAGLEHEEFLETLPSLLSRTEECSKRIDGIVKNLKAYVREGPKSMTYLDINEVIRSAIELAKSFIQKATENFRLDWRITFPR